MYGGKRTAYSRGAGPRERGSAPESRPGSGTREDLRQLLMEIDHRGYPAYKQTRGRWTYGKYVLSIDHVQGDPFASPSKVSVIVPGKTAGFPEEFYAQPHRRVALEDHLLRCFGRELAAKERRYAGSGKSGLVMTSRPGQEILERTACRVNQAGGDVTLRFEIGFPANGRTINAGELLRILEDFLPGAVTGALLYANLDQKRVQDVMNLSDDQKYIRDELSGMGLCAFVADGAVLPRQSGISQLPMKDAVPFQSPESMAVTLSLPKGGVIRGMGIKKGVTLIIGGGYHGKSTLLQALERGVYNHIRGDGREYVITDQTAVKVRAEDGRSIARTDISLFIHDLPNGKDTVHFTTEDASGSTSQAANVIEAWEAGTGTLLMDEDTSATNFMVRDELMAGVVSGDQEPITPFISRIRAFYEQAGISTILVAGSSGAFFYVADAIIQMDRYRPVDVTQKAHAAALLAAGKEGQKIAGTEADEKEGQKAAGMMTGDEEGRRAAGTITAGCGAEALHGLYDAGGFSAPDFSRVVGRANALLRDDRIKLKVLSEDGFLIQKDEVELRGLEQIADREQTAALSYILKYALLHFADGKRTLTQIVDMLEKTVKEKGLEVLFDGGCIANGLAGVRREEIFGMISRYRRFIA